LKAPCVGSTHIFYPPTGATGTRYSQMAKECCATCDYGYECLVRWLETPVYTDYGIWFGTSPGERTGLKKSGLREALGIELVTWLDERLIEADRRAEVRPKEADPARQHRLERDRARSRRRRARLKAARQKEAA
jgi:hypothetical protein